MKKRCNICGYIQTENNPNLECPLCHAKTWYDYDENSSKIVIPKPTFIDAITEFENNELTSDIVVNFLGTEYVFPKELKKYVAYCNCFDIINERLNKTLYKIMQNPNISDGTNSQLWDIDETLRKQIKDEGKQILYLLGKHGIFNVTERELIDDNKGYILFQDAYKTMFNGFRLNLADEMESFLNNIDGVQRAAYSQVTGTGISMYSNSLVAHLTLAAFESSTVKKQCMKADRDYERAMDNLIASGRSNREKADARTMAETYPKLVESFSTFVNELMNKYLFELQNKGLFDYSKIMSYNIQRSSDLLGNLSFVEDKHSVFKLAFEQCPYNPDIYAKMFELNVGNIDTYMIAKEFYQDVVLLDFFKKEYKKSKGDLDKQSLIINIMAKYNNTSEKDAILFAYSKELKPIKTRYKNLTSAIKYKKSLDKWIRSNITPFTEQLVLLEDNEIENKVLNQINSIISNEQMEKYNRIGLSIADIICLDNNDKTEKETINSDIYEKIIICIKEYIEEAKRRKKRLDDAIVMQEYEIEKQKKAIKDKKAELTSLGFFSGSKKKEVKETIVKMENELQRYKQSNKEVDELKRAFDDMYKE